MEDASDFDVIIAGGGLSGGLVAWRLAHQHPRLAIALLEQGSNLGGNHTWSFHATDIAPTAMGWVKPFISYAWPGQKVSFPDNERQLTTPYQSITSDRFHQVLTSGPSNLTIMTGVDVTDARRNSVVIRTAEGGEKTLTAPLVFDARGPFDTNHLSLGFQKFLGLEVTFDNTHKEFIPTIMDATVPQTDGYRFVYVLPLSPHSAIIEDTYYADGAELPRDVLRQEIKQYAEAKGWIINAVIREEDGILPIVLDGNIDAFWETLKQGAAPLGLRAGLFHPVTGYSVPDSVAVADIIAANCPSSTDEAFQLVESHAKARWQEHSFYRMLNRMLFRAAKPEQRYRVLERFYKLPQPLIERFYAGANTLPDRMRILAGKPPVPISRAIRHLVPSRKGEPIREGTLG